MNVLVACSRLLGATHRSYFRHFHFNAATNLKQREQLRNSGLSCRQAARHYAASHRPPSIATKGAPSRTIYHADRTASATRSRKSKSKWLYRCAGAVFPSMISSMSGKAFCHICGALPDIACWCEKASSNGTRSITFSDATVGSDASRLLKPFVTGIVKNHNAFSESPLICFNTVHNLVRLDSGFVA